MSMSIGAQVSQGNNTFVEPQKTHESFHNNISAMDVEDDFSVASRVDSIQRRSMAQQGRLKRKRGRGVSEKVSKEEAEVRSSMSSLLSSYTKRRKREAQYSMAQKTSAQGNGSFTPPRLPLPPLNLPPPMIPPPSSPMSSPPSSPPPPSDGDSSDETEAAVKIQRAARGFLAIEKAKRMKEQNQFFGFLKRELTIVFQFLKDLQFRVRDSLIKRVITQRTADGKMNQLKSVATRFNGLKTILEKRISEQEDIDLKVFRATNEKVLAEIKRDLEQVCREAGFLNINDGMDFALGSGWEKSCSERSRNSITFFNRHFVPTGFTRVKTRRSDSGVCYLTSENGLTLPGDAKRIAEGMPFLTRHRFFKADTVYEKLHGAEISVPFVKQDGSRELVVFKGYFHKDPLNLHHLGGWIGRKKALVERRASDIYIPVYFKKGYLAQYSTRDLALNNVETILGDLKNAYSELQQLRRKQRPTLSREFALAPMEKQLRMLTLLLLDPTSNNGKLLYSLTAAYSPPFKEFLRQNMHYTLQREVDLSEDSVEALRKSLAQNANRGIPLPVQIENSQMDHATKKRAMEMFAVSQGRGADAGKAMEWLKRLLQVPFGKYVEPPLAADATRAEKQAYIKQVKEVLDNAVHGHEKGKRKILRIVGQWINRGTTDGEIMAIQGPPGNGKTTLVMQGVAKALGRPFVKINAGGITDASFLEGHGYTYVGSKPGRIVEFLRETGCMNPIIYIDELDKISRTPKGEEIVGVLTHLLDTSQNNEFQDKYFDGINFDLSKCLIICSFNDFSKVDGILGDRIHMIPTGPLTPKDKVRIGREYLLPTILETVGFRPDDLKISNETLEYIIANHSTHEAGVRELKRCLFSLVREVNLKCLFDVENPLPLEITTELVDEFLEARSIHLKRVAERPLVGNCNGMYATRSGMGGITFIQAFRKPAETFLELELTGNQGKVMQESMMTARTVAWNLLPGKLQKELREISENSTFGLHIHVPEGATPKDGPSAGGAITAAMVSQLTGFPLRQDTCMTGEIDLNGNITKIGGLYSKIKGARQAGARFVLVPRENQEDLDEAMKKDPELFDERNGIRPVIVDNIYDILRNVMVPSHARFPWERLPSAPTSMEE